jgi:hypothetical protein
MQSTILGKGETMAKKASKKKVSKKGPGKKKASTAAVYLIKQTEMGSQLAPEEHKADIDRIHDYIQKAGGTCALLGNKAKDANEFVSIVRGLTPARQKGMIAVIEQSGDVKALRLHILKGGP